MGLFNLFMTESACFDALTARSAKLASAAERTSLYVLRAIDETVESLSKLRRRLTPVTSSARDQEAKVRALKVHPEKYLDPEDQTIMSLERTYEALESSLAKYVLKRSCIDKDPELTSDHRALLHSSYEDALDAIAQLIEALKDLRAAIIAHDLAAEPRARQTFEDCTSLIESLRSP